MKITKSKLKELIVDELRELNIFHNTDGEFSDKRSATSTSGPTVGQNEYPSGKDKRKCGRKHPSRKHCKKVEGKVLNPLLQDDISREEIEYLKKIIAQAIQQTLSAAAAKNDCSFQDLVRAQTVWSKAQSAKSSNK